MFRRCLSVVRRASSCHTFGTGSDPARELDVTDAPTRSPSSSRGRGLLYLIRHVEVELRDGVPPEEWPPTPAGLEAADRLAGEPFGRDLSLVATSPEPKAVAAAQDADPRARRLRGAPRALPRARGDRGLGAGRRRARPLRRLRRAPGGRGARPARCRHARPRHLALPRLRRRRVENPAPARRSSGADARVTPSAA